MITGKELFDKKFIVRFNFDGSVSTSQNSNAQEKRRAVGFDGDKSSFTWKRFITLEDSYNPYLGELNPWSLKKWYQWGCRRFHFHNPFGKVAAGNSQELVYEVDQFLNAKNGLTINGVVQNTPMPWLVNDFVSVIKALTTGQQGTLDSQTWTDWTSGPNAWFNPSQPIDLIVYIGGMANPGSDSAYKIYVDKWNALFTATPTIAARRLKDSVAPLIEARCRIGFDAAVASPGAVPGDHIPLAVQNERLQKGWWTFFKWVTTTIGKDRVYVESHPFYINNKTNSYLGYNVIADDDWSYTPVVPSGMHMTSEMGDVEFLRAIWQNTEITTPLISSEKNNEFIKERYWFLHNSHYAIKNETTKETRLSPADCCEKGHNYYWATLYDKIIAYHMIEKQNTRNEINERKNITNSAILVPNTLLQVLPSSYADDPNWKLQFGNLYRSSQDFIKYLDYILDKKKTTEDIIYS
jgi:hypothetical protein